MKSTMFTLFRVTSFPHNGKIATIDKCLFVGPTFTTIHSPSLNGPYVQLVSPPPQVKYVSTHPTLSIVEETKPLIACSSSLDLYSIVDMGISSIGILKSNLITHVVALHMYPL
jgi:hypothetical protein